MRLKFGLLSACLLIVNCGSDSGVPSVSGKTSVVMGPSTTARSGLEKRVCPPSNGNWFLSPNQGKVTFNKITFALQGESGDSQVDVTLSNCTATYDRSKSSGSSLLECPLSIPQGKITRVMLYYSPTFEILVNDATNCIYTDPASSTGLATTPPAGGATFATFKVTAKGSDDFVSDLILPQPFEVKAGDTPTFSIITDMINSMPVTVTGGNTITFSGASPSPLVQVFGTFSATGKSEFYTEKTTAENVFVNTDTGFSHIRVFYGSANEAMFVSNGFVAGCVTGDFPTQATNANPSVSPVSDKGFKAGGFLGMDAANKISWALPESFTYEKYRSLLVLPRATAIGQSVNLQCQFLNGTAAPAPASGNTYASGAPAITPTSTTAYTLRAN